MDDLQPAQPPVPPVLPQGRLTNSFWYIGIALLIVGTPLAFLPGTFREQAMALAVLTTAFLKLVVNPRRQSMAGKDRLLFAGFIGYVLVCGSFAFLMSGPSRACLHAPPNQPDQTIVACDQLLQAKTLRGTDKAAALAQRGAAQYKLHKSDAAIADFTAALAINPKNSALLAQRSEAYRRIGRYDLALADMNAVLATDPNHVLMLAERAALYATQKKYDLAFSDLRQALHRNPQFALVIILRAAVHSQMRDYHEAIEDYDLAESLMPSSPAALRSLLLSGRADTYFADGQDDKAAAEVKEALQLDPDSDAALSLRALMEMKQGDTKAALADLNRAADIDPEDSDTLMQRGVAKFYSGDLTGAINDITDSMPHAATDDAKILRIIWLHLARQRAGQDDTKEFADNSLTSFADAWPLPLLALYHGGSVDEVMAKAKIGTSVDQADQACDADFYIGHYDLLKGQKDAAKPLFEAALKDCAPDDLEYAAAKIELQKLAAP